MSCDGLVLTGWGAIARTQERAAQVVQDHMTRRPRRHWVTHRGRLAHFVIDVDDLDAGATFWSAALDAKEEPLSEASSRVYRRLRLPDSEIRVLLQRTGDRKRHKERMHLDLETDDVDTEVADSKLLAQPATTTSRNAATTSGYSATPGPTSSAFLQINFPNVLAQRPPWSD
jgi:hypothetical protein